MLVNAFVVVSCLILFNWNAFSRSDSIKEIRKFRNCQKNYSYFGKLVGIKNAEIFRQFAEQQTLESVLEGRQLKTKLKQKTGK